MFYKIMFCVCMFLSFISSMIFQNIHLWFVAWVMGHIYLIPIEIERR